MKSPKQKKIEKFICSECHKEIHINAVKNDWDPIYGDKDLWEKWSHFQIIYEGSSFSIKIRSITPYG